MPCQQHQTAKGVVWVEETVLSGASGITQTHCGKNMKNIRKSRKTVSHRVVFVHYSTWREICFWKKCIEGSIPKKLAKNWTMFSILSYHNNYSVHTGSRLEYYSREGERDPLRGYDEGTQAWPTMPDPLSSTDTVTVVGAGLRNVKATIFSPSSIVG